MAQPKIDHAGKTKYEMSRSTTWKTVEIDSKECFEIYGANLQAITLANNLPLFEIGDAVAQEDWENIINRSNFLETIVENERFLFANAISCLGFYDAIYSDDDGNEIENTTFIHQAQPILFTRVGNVLTYLLLQIDTITDSIGTEFVICEEWIKDNLQVNYIALSNSQLTLYLTGQTVTTPTRYDPSSIALYDNKYYSAYINSRPNHLKNIPYTIFFDNAKLTSPIQDVPQIFFANLNSSLQLIQPDLLISRAFMFISDVISKGTITKDKVLDATENIFNSNTSATLFGGEGAKILQGTAQTQLIWQNINANIQKIKELAFIRVSSSDLGKNNKQTTEIESINADSDDSIENKANLREKAYKDLIINWKKYENDKLSAQKYTFKASDINVVVSGSTKWLQTEAAKYKANQLGITRSNLQNNSTDTNQVTGGDE